MHHKHIKEKYCIKYKMVLQNFFFFSFSFILQSCRSTIYRNLYICLLFIEILFLIGIELSEDHVLCGFTSAFLHCSFLSATGWIFFEGKYKIKNESDFFFTFIEHNINLQNYILQNIEIIKIT